MPTKRPSPSKPGHKPSGAKPSADNDRTQETELPSEQLSALDSSRFEPLDIDEAIDEPLEDITGVADVTGRLKRQLGAENTGSLDLGRIKRRP